MRPADLYPGDLILYKNHGLVGNLIAWGQWNGTPQEALEYSHVGLVLDALQSIETNPPSCRKFWLGDVPWDRVKVYRVRIEGVEPFRDSKVQDEFVRRAVTQLGRPYGYGNVAAALGIGILARLGLGGLARKIASKDGPAGADCSILAETLVADTLKRWHPGFDLFPDMGERWARPSDFPRSPFIHPVN